MVLKALHQRINCTVVPERTNRRSKSTGAVAIEDLAPGADSLSSSSSTMSTSDSTIELLDSDDDDREVSDDDVVSNDDCNVPAHGNTGEPILQLCTIYVYVYTTCRVTEYMKEPVYMAQTMP